MSPNYTHFANLAGEIEPPAHGTLSRTVYQDERVKAVLFAFAAGEELSEHTASSAAIMHFLDGQAAVTLGEDTIAANAGTWIHMPPQLRHGIRTQSPVIMLLLLLKQASA